MMWTTPLLAIDSAELPSIRSSPSVMVPDIGLIRPDIASSMVVLPWPLGPITTAVLPAPTERLRSRTTTVRS